MTQQTPSPTPSEKPDIEPSFSTNYPDPQPIETAKHDNLQRLVSEGEEWFTVWWSDSGRYTMTGQPGWVNTTIDDITGMLWVFNPTHWVPAPPYPPQVPRPAQTRLLGIRRPVGGQTI